MLYFAKMKVRSTKNCTAFLFLFFAFFLISGGVNAQNLSNEITITGKVLEYDLKSNSNLLEIIFEDILEKRINVVSQIDLNGNFNFSLIRPYAQTGMLIIGDHLYNFYAAPGDTQHFEINVIKDEIKFKGSHNQFNRQLDSYFHFINDNQSDINIQDSIMKTSEPMVYRTYIEERGKYFTAILSDFFKNNKSTTKFKVWVNTEQKYWLMTELMQYRWFNPYKNKTNWDSFFLSIPKEYFSFLDDSLLIEPTGLKTQFFYYFLNEYYNYRSSDNVPKDSSEKATLLYKAGNELASFKIRARQLHSKEFPFTQDLLLSRFYHQVLGWGKTAAFNSLINEHPINEEKLKQRLQLKYDKLKELEKGSGKTNRIHFNVRLEGVKQGIIDTIIKQHLGKVLYIDFWAPWCKPCMAEVPYAQKIKEQVDSEKITFIYLGAQCDQGSWRTTIAEKEMKGEHYLLSDEQYKLMEKEFKIKGIPHYLIIDTEGKVAVNNAPKPRETDELLEILYNLTSTKFAPGLRND